MRSVAGAWLGLLTAVGVLVVVARVPWLRRIRPAHRVLPYLRDVLPADAVPGTVPDPGAGLRVAAETWARRARDASAARLDRLLGGTESVRRRLDQLGAAGSVHDVRVQQVVWVSVAVASTLALGLLRAVAGAAPSPPLLAALCIAAGIGAVVACDRRLTRRVAATNEAVLAQLPSVADLLALSVSAGESPAAAVERVARIGRGELCRELQRVTDEARTSTLAPALAALGRRTGVVALRRLVDVVVVSLDRGTPVAAVLRAQAVDAREAARRDLMERAARREVVMMLPVVFLVLPVSVVFALFPGFWGLRLTA